MNFSHVHITWHLTGKNEMAFFMREIKVFKILI